MSKNYLFFLFFVVTFSVFGQNSNNLILYQDGRQTEDVVYFCEGESFDLKVIANASATGNYNLTPNNAMSFTNATTPVPFENIVGNNLFSKVVNIGFDFDFFGVKYSKVVVGSNGRLLFSNSLEFENLKNRNVFIDRTFSGNFSGGTNSKIPSVNYNKVYQGDLTKNFDMAQIFAGYTDLNYPGSVDYQSIKYGYGTYLGKKTFEVSFNRIRELGVYDDSRILTSHIIILEDNSYYIKVSNKANQYNAIYGAQNATGTRAVWPVNNDVTSIYNNGKWGVGSNPVSYSFTPSQNLVPVISWTNNGTSVSSTTNYVFTPSQNEELIKVNILFKDDDGNQVGNVEEGKVTFKKIMPIVLNNPTYDTSTCAGLGKLNIQNPDPNLIYYWYNTNNPATPIATGETSINVNNGTYYVVAKTSSGKDCGKSNEQTITVSSAVPGFTYSGKTIRACGSANTLTYDLTTLYPLSPNYDVEFVDGATVYNATTGYSIVLSSGVSKNLKINVVGKGTSSGCTINGATFTLEYQTFPPNGLSLTSKKLCFGTSTYTVSQFKLDFPQYNLYDVKFSKDGINFNVDEINLQQNVSVKFKLSLADYTCSTIGDLKVDFYDDVIANTPTTQLPPQCASATEYFDLNVLVPEINPSSDVDVTFHRTLAEAQSGNNPVDKHFRSGIGVVDLYIRVKNRITGCVSSQHPMIQLRVYLKPQILVQNPIIQYQCEGNSIYNLEQKVADLVSADADVNIVVEYFSENNVLLTGTQITQYDANVYGRKPYIKLTYNPTCGTIISFDLRNNPKPIAQKTKWEICGQTTFPASQVISEIINQSSNYTFTLGDGSALPTQFSVSTLPAIYTILIKDKTTGCISDPITIRFESGLATPLIASSVSVNACDAVGDLFDGITTFSLEFHKSKFISDSNADVQYFLDAALTRPVSGSLTISSSQKVYLKITLPGFCPSIAELTLNANTPIKSSTLLNKYLICYGSSVVVDAGPENTQFQWSGGTQGSSSRYRLFNQAGNYTVTLTNANGCSYTHNFVISDEQQPVISQINQDNEKIEVIASGGVTPYQYSFDGGLTWGSSNILNNPILSGYTIQVRSTLSNGSYCLGAPKSIYSVTMSNVITTNGDGRNDIWEVKNLDKMEQIDLQIVDRYGKSVFQSNNANKTSWDGTINGRSLSTGTYWYAVKWFDPSTLKQEVRQGWILLQNRD